MKPCVWIIIVNYRTSQLVIDCLNSLAPQVDDLGGGQVIVVDNASQDGSVEALTAAITEQGWATWARVLPQPRNGGFAYGNNAGIQVALSIQEDADYLLLLNPDTVARPNALSALTKFMALHPRAGIVGSLLENSSGEVDSSAHRIHSPLSELVDGARLGVLSRTLRRFAVSEPPRDEAHECDWVSGASLMVRCSVVQNIGLLDEDFFLYFEEVDFCCRAKLSGWQVWYAPESRVLHLEGASTGIRSSKRRASYWYDSRRRFFIKHHGIAGLLLADVLWGLGRATFLLRRTLRLGASSNNLDPRWYMYDLIWGDLRAMLNGKTWQIPRLGSRS